MGVAAHRAAGRLRSWSPPEVPVVPDVLYVLLILASFVALLLLVRVTSR
ncbi:hypothetical protein [Jannaschia sp. R86511]